VRRVGAVEVARGNGGEVAIGGRHLTTNLRGRRRAVAEPAGAGSTLGARRVRYRGGLRDRGEPSSAGKAAAHLQTDGAAARRQSMVAWPLGRPGGTYCAQSTVASSSRPADVRREAGCGNQQARTRHNRGTVGGALGRVRQL
jgi:hypothetical protein